MARIATAPAPQDAAARAALAQLAGEWPGAQPLAASPVMLPLGKPAYRGAAIDKQTSGWQPGLLSGDAAIGDSWNLLTARISDLVRNEPSLGKAKTDLCKHIIGQGIHSFADVIDGAGEYIDDFNDESDEWFERWAEEEADVQGRLGWHDMQWHALDQTIEQGECLLLKCLDNSPGRSLPLCYQMLEAAQLDEGKNEDARDGRNRIVRGVELDRRNRAVAYWIFDAHPYDRGGSWTAESARIPADRVVHFYLPMPISATRGISWFHALVRATRDVDFYLGSELTAAALGALLTMVHKQDRQTSGGLGLADGNSDSDDFGNGLTKLGPGTIARIPKGDEIEIKESARPGRQVGPFMNLMRQEQAMGAKLSYITLTGDFSATSFTSAHGAANEENAYFRPLQARIARSIIRPVRREHTRFAVGYGLFRTLSATQFAKQPFRWTRLLSQGPGRDQLNPLDQSGAAIDRMRSAQSTLADECAQTGKNWRKVLRMKARVEREAARLGTTIDLTRGGGPTSGNISQATAEEQQRQQAEQAARLTADQGGD